MLQKALSPGALYNSVVMKYAKDGVVREVDQTRRTTTDLPTIPGSRDLFHVALGTNARELYVGASDGSIDVVDFVTRTVRSLVSSGVFP